MDFLRTLNPEQKRAVTHEDGPLLIVAGAGTGKTTVITQRVAWLIAEGMAQSDEILAVTFTDKAAGEMEERVDRLLPLGYLDLWISTFHSFCQRVLQDHAIDVGLPGDFKLLDGTAQWMLVRQNLDRFDLDYYRPLGNPTKFIHALIKHFSRAKDEAVGPEEYIDYVENLKLNMDTAESTGGGIRVRKSKTNPKPKIRNSKQEMDSIVSLSLDVSDISRLEEVANAYHVYQQILLENNALDFGDLINYTLKLFQKRPRILEKYRGQFKYILVDEFQDTNWAQYELIKLLAHPKDNLTVVADDDQSIYKFRGASVSNVTQFKKDFGSADVVSLVINYRSKQSILDLSYDFIQLNNPNRLEAQSLNGKKISKRLKAHNKGKGVIEYLVYEDQYQEAEGVVEKISKSKIQNSKYSWSDYAVLVRANAQADIFIQTFETAGIPYQFVASRGLYTKRVILDIINFLKLLDDYHESASLWRVLNWPVFNFSVRTLQGMTHYAKKKSLSLYQALHYFQHQKIVEETERVEMKRVIALIEQHTRRAQEKRPREVILGALEESGYLKWLASQEDAFARQQLFFLEQFDKKLREFEAGVPDPTVKLFLEEIQMELDSGEAGQLAIDLDSGPEAVKIMTVHAAKGLEFKHVFIVGMVDKRFPSIGRREQIELPDALVKEALPEGDIHLQEERRLFYVAMTRARENLFFTRALNYGGKTKKKPSRFLYELNFIGKESMVSVQKETRARAGAQGSQIPNSKFQLPKKISYTQLKTFETCPYQYRFAHILKVPVRANYSLSFGKTMHAVLKRFLEFLKDHQFSDQGSLFSEGIQENAKSLKHENKIMGLKDLMKIYEEEWIDDWYETKKHRDEYHDKGKRILKDFYELVIAHPPVVKYLEQGFNLKLKDSETKQVCTIFGVIDRVDVMAGDNDDNEVEIIDYKTGSVKSEKTMDKDQLLLYQIAATDALMLRPRKLTYYYLDENKPVSFFGSKEDIEKLKRKIFDFIKKIQQSDFRADPSQFKCKYCDYRNICEYRVI